MNGDFLALLPKDPFSQVTTQAAPHLTPVQATQWDYILVQGKEKKIELDLRNLFDPNLIRDSLVIMSKAETVEDLLQLKFAKLV